MSRTNRTILRIDDIDDKLSDEDSILPGALPPLTMHMTYAGLFRDDISWKRRRLEERRQETENALDQIIALLKNRGAMKANAIAGILHIHTDIIAGALKIGNERGCIVRRQIDGAKRNYFTYDLSDGTRRYVTGLGLRYRLNSNCTHSP